MGATAPLSKAFAPPPPVGGNLGFLSDDIWQNDVRKRHLIAILAPLSEPPAPLSEDFWRLHIYVFSFQSKELVFRLATEEKTINDLLEVGENLAGERLRINDNKVQVKNDLKLLKKRKTKLNARLIGQQERYQCLSLFIYLPSFTLD